mgnify:FL=1
MKWHKWPWTGRIALIKPTKKIKESDILCFHFYLAAIYIVCLKLIRYFVFKSFERGVILKIDIFEPFARYKLKLKIKVGQVKIK